MISAKRVAAISQMHQEFSYFGDYIMTKRGSLIGALRLRGLDPDALNNNDLIGLTNIAQSFYQHLDSQITVTQYYVHYNGVEVAMASRDNPISHTLSKRRQAFINKQKLSSTDLVHFFEISPSQALSQLGGFDLFMHLSKAPFDAQSRDVVSRHYSKIKSIQFEIGEMKKQAGALTDYLDDVVSRWDGVFQPEKMPLNALWGFTKFLANLDPYYLSDAFQSKAPETAWDSTLPDGASFSPRPLRKKSLVSNSSSRR